VGGRGKAEWDPRIISKGHDHSTATGMTSRNSRVDKSTEFTLDQKCESLGIARAMVVVVASDTGAAGSATGTGLIPTHRSFEADCEGLARDWNREAMSPMPWSEDRSQEQTHGVEGGLWVVSSSFRAHAKPRKPVDPQRRPIAAIEKIVADLAYRLNLPVPPVTLWERDDAPEGEARHHAVSAVPFAGLEDWTIMRHPGVAAMVLPHCAEPMSAMSVFDTWVECRDHVDHGENLLVSFLDGKAVFAFIDYSDCMLPHWRHPGYKNMFTAPLYRSGIKPLAEVVQATVSAVEGIADSTIDEIVGRIPAAFLAEDDASLIIEGLKFRRDSLRGLLGTEMGGVLG